MNNLEDRANDWLAQEMRREGIVRSNTLNSQMKINAASRLAMDHQDSCEAEQLRRNHARNHAASAARDNLNRANQRRGNGYVGQNNWQGNKNKGIGVVGAIVSVIIWLFIITSLFFN